MENIEKLPKNSIAYKVVYRYNNKPGMIGNNIMDGKNLKFLDEEMTEQMIREFKENGVKIMPDDINNENVIMIKAKERLKNVGIEYEFDEYGTTGIKRRLARPEKEAIFQNFLKDADNDIFSLNVDIPSYGITITTRPLSICFQYSFHSVYRRFFNEWFLYPSENIKDGGCFRILFHNGYINTVSSRNMIIPLTMKSLKKMYKIAEKVTENAENVFSILVETILGMYEDNGLYSVKDILKVLHDKNDFIIPITITDIINADSLSSVLEKRYPHVKNWGKYDPSWLYLTWKASKKVLSEDANKILNITGEQFFNRNWGSYSPESIFSLGSCHGYTREGCKGRDDALNTWIGELLTRYYFDKLELDRTTGLCNSWVINDYIKLCMKSGTRVNLSLRSFTGIKDEHDLLLRKFGPTGKKIKVTIPKDSLFNKLRELLPEDFEWIKTGKRLAAEGVSQHNCVARLYCEPINKDQYAAYSLNYEGEPITLGFKWDKYDEKYRADQIYTTCNKRISERAQDYIISIFKKTNGQIDYTCCGGLILKSN